MAKWYSVFLLLDLTKSNLIVSNSIIDYSHEKGEPLSILAGSLSSRRGIIPYDYTRLNICNSQKVVKVKDTLGEILTEEVLYTTEYMTNTNDYEFYKVLCYNSFSFSNS